MSHLFRRIRVRDLARVPVRYKNGPLHWATLRKKKWPKDKALEHFNDFYASVYGKSWENIRTALLEEKHKYMAVVNNYSDTQRIRTNLESQGAFNLKTVYDSFKRRIDEKEQEKKDADKGKRTEVPHDLDHQMNAVLSNIKSTALADVYSAEGENIPNSLSFETEENRSENEEEDEESPRPQKKVIPELHSIENELNEIEVDSSRIVSSSMGTSSLHEYIPATKLKGMEDFILESEYYNHYIQGSDYVVDVVKENSLSFPEHLHVYTFEMENDTRFKAPEKGSTNLLDYYLFDGASVLPVLALDLKPGDAVLDMCAAPGGKTLTILQTFAPRFIVANDKSLSRLNRIKGVLNQFVGNIGWQNRLILSQQDARQIEDADVFNKILVDVPCTTDRHVLHNDENNLFKPSRIQERLQLPEVQTEILVAALKIVKLGGTVVYSTCSLSPVQNAGVVQMALKKAYEETNHTLVVKDMSKALKPLQGLFKFGTRNVKYGHIAIPTLQNNWGPMYFCKIVRTA